MKTKILVILLSLGLVATIFAWHIDHLHLVSEQNEKLADYQKALEAATTGEIKGVQEQSELRHTSESAVLALLKERQDWTEKYNALVDRFNGILAAAKSIDSANDRENAQNEELRTLLASAQRQSAEPMPSPRPVTTTGTVMHPDGTMSEINLETR